MGPQKTQTPPGVGSGIAANFVLAGLGPAIHALGGQSEEWMRIKSAQEGSKWFYASPTQVILAGKISPGQPLALRAEGLSLDP